MRKIEFAIAVKSVILGEDGVLLLKKHEKEMIGDASNNSWDLPGGRVSYMETCERAVEREVKEETRLVVKEVQLKSASTVIRPDGLHLVILLYSCKCEKGEVQLSEEHSMYQWFRYKELMDNALIPEWIKKSVEKCQE